MKNLIFLLCCSICLHSISTAVTNAATIVPASSAPTYSVAITPVVTPHSHQVVARNYNRWYVPVGSYVPASYVPTTTTTTIAAAYPYYYYHPTTTATTYRYGYGYYPAYGYSYGYGTAVPTAFWR